MNKILALWATPRSTSTAFEWVMANRGDMLCFHEPYNEAFYYGEGRRSDRYYIAESTIKAPPELTMDTVHRKLKQKVQCNPVFIKDFAYSIMHFADDAFLDSFTHTFLIRDPEKVITSMCSRWPDLALGELGYEDLHTLFKRIADRTGSVPPVLDSDELLARPASGIEAYCNAVNLPFIPEAMNWEDAGEKGQPANPTWNTDKDGFHDKLKTSTGLQKQSRNYPPLDSNPHMERLFRVSLPHYEALYAHRLKF